MCELWITTLDSPFQTIKPEFGNPDPESVALGRNFCEGASMFNRFLFPAKVVMATTQNIFDVDSRSVHQRLKKQLRESLHIPYVSRFHFIHFSARRCPR